MITLITLKEVKETEAPYSFSRLWVRPGPRHVHLRVHGLEGVHGVHGLEGVQCPGPGRDQGELLPAQELNRLSSGRLIVQIFSQRSARQSGESRKSLKSRRSKYRPSARPGIESTFHGKN